MKQIWITFFYPTLAFVLLVVGACENPLKEEKKKQEVLRLVDDYLASGRYNIFWDGKDSKGKYISAGKYIYVMEAGDFTDQFFMNAQEGGTGKLNDSTFYEPWPGYIGHELGQNSPEPFKIKNGTNIPFRVGPAARVRVTIYKD